jgi:hypothetical protein
MNHLLPNAVGEKDDRRTTGAAVDLFVPSWPKLRFCIILVPIIDKSRFKPLNNVCLHLSMAQESG